MAKTAKNDSLKINPTVVKRNEELTHTISDMLQQMQLSLYGTTDSQDTMDLSAKFNNIMQTELDSMNRHSSQEMTSFITNLFKDEITRGGGANGNLQGLDAVFNAEDGNVLNFLSEAYQNRMLKYSDLKEVSSQLVELRESIKITRDTITSADTTEGNVSKSIAFDFSDKSTEEDRKSIIKQMETKFKLDNKIKNFIIPNTLTYGSYYSYVVPYAKLFSDFMIKKNKSTNFMGPANAASMESAEDNVTSNVVTLESTMDDSEFKEYSKSIISRLSNVPKSEVGRPTFEDSLTDDIKELASHISICNSFDPSSPLMESSGELFEYFEHGYFTETQAKEKNNFEKYHNIDTGALEIDTKDDKKIRKQFADIKDCCIRLIDPIHMIPVKILEKVIGYYYIEEDNIEPVNGILTSTIYNNRYDGRNTQRTVIDKLASKIVKAFDKNYLTANSKMKDLIAESLMYYDLNSKSIRFQFIPAEYVVDFKVNEDENGDGVSALEDSLFYAKLYLMLLLFKIVSIVLYSNDTKVNYIKTSGIDKNIANKIQEIAREKQSRQINLMDLMSYTSIINKIGRGNETYIPVGRSGDRGLETEILQGQDVQLDTPLMEMLKTSYILGTGVPSAIMNYLNEADFAKSIETANTKFQGRVMSNQLDFNDGITRLYRMVARFSTTLETNELDSLEVKLTPPKFANNNIKQEMLNSFSALRDFLIQLYYGDSAMQDPAMVNTVRSFTKKIAKEYLPAINFEQIEKFLDEAKTDALSEDLDPKNKAASDEIDALSTGF